MRKAVALNVIGSSVLKGGYTLRQMAATPPEQLDRKWDKQFCEQKGLYSASH